MFSDASERLLFLLFSVPPDELQTIHIHAGMIRLLQVGTRLK